MFPKLFIRGVGKQKPIRPFSVSFFSFSLSKSHYATEKAKLEGFEELLKRRFFYAPSFSIYGGTAGLYDLGPIGSGIKWNLLNLWKEFFIDGQENVFQIDTSAIIPEPVLQASGHTQKFTDLLIIDKVTEQCFRADHLLVQYIDQLLNDNNNVKDIKYSRELLEKIKRDAGGYNKEQMIDAFNKIGFDKHPETNNPISEPFPFNLMFETKIGAEGKVRAYLRPETAQGIFVNFQRLLDQAGNKLPFGVATIGQAYRNEVSPRQGLLRTREFTMAEIEHFVFPDQKDHPQYQQIKSQILPLFPQLNQQSNEPKVDQMMVEEAVNSKLISSECMGYYLVKTLQFLESCGLDRTKIRFRQHLKDEMAHYAIDCWDAEIYSSRFGWIECVGIADRACFDLSQHGKFTSNTRAMQVFRNYPDGPKWVELYSISPKQPSFGQLFKNKGGSILSSLNSLPSSELKSFKEKLNENQNISFSVESEEINLNNSLITIKETKKLVEGEPIFPHVIEPSFGIGRILYFILEHNYWTRDEDVNRCVLSLPIQLSPITCSVLPLQNTEEFQPIIKDIVSQLITSKIAHKVDDAAQSIGKRYARTDELGIPFAITVDFDSLKGEDSSVTLRERDSLEQIRVPLCDLISILKDIKERKVNWQSLKIKFPSV